MSDRLCDSFEVSEALAWQIGQEQLRQTHKKRRGPWLFTNRLDITSTEAPTFADESLSISRASAAIKERFGQFVASLARRAYEANMDSVPIATSTRLVEKFGNALAREFGFNKPTDHKIWSAAFARELRVWLSAFPNKRKIFRWGILAVLKDNSIVLLPSEQKP